MGALGGSTVTKVSDCHRDCTVTNACSVCNHFRYPLAAFAAAETRSRSAQALWNNTVAYLREQTAGTAVCPLRVRNPSIVTEADPSA
jgi:hypothetical protein